jgi:hypothetical protein
VDSDGFRVLAADLADNLRAGLPGVPDSHIARVLLRLEPALERIAADQEDPAAALTAIWDALLGAPVPLAALDLALAERGSW